MADKDIESDGSFESADEGADEIVRDETSTEKGISENVKRKEEPQNESPPKDSPETQNTEEQTAVTEEESEEIAMKDESGSNTNEEGVDNLNLEDGVKEEPEGSVSSDSPPQKESEPNVGEVDSNIEKEGAVISASEIRDNLGRQTSMGTNESTGGGATEPEEGKEAKPDDKREAEPSPINQSIDRSDPTENRSGPPQSGQSSWGSWGGSWSGWGSSLYSSATATVSAVSGSVGKVIGSAESSAGIPPAEDLASTDQTQAPTDDTTGTNEGQQDGDPSDQSQPTTSPGAAVGSIFSYGASAITTVVGKTVSGGLDALEVIGKKTMDVLQEGDPGLKKTKAYFHRKDGQNLSQMLREAKEEAEVIAQYQEEEEERQKCHFGWLFEQNQGLAHLEALEILSNESEMKVEAVVGGVEDESNEPLKTELMEIKDAFELEDIETEEADDDADFVNTITEHLFGLSIAATPDKLKRVQTDAHDWLAKLDEEAEDTQTPGAKEIHQKAMEVLADLTARSIEQFHKTGELLLLKQVTEENKSPIQQATSLSKLTSALCAEVSFVASKFSEKLSKMAATTTDGTSETINGYVTNIFLEASNSTSYIQDAFQLLLPVMQVVAIDQKQDP